MTRQGRKKEAPGQEQSGDLKEEMCTLDSHKTFLLDDMSNRLTRFLIITWPEINKVIKV